MKALRLRFGKGLEFVQTVNWRAHGLAAWAAFLTALWGLRVIVALLCRAVVKLGVRATHEYQRVAPVVVTTVTRYWHAATVLIKCRWQLVARIVGEFAAAAREQIGPVAKPVVKFMEDVKKQTVRTLKLASQQIQQHFATELAGVYEVLVVKAESKAAPSNETSTTNNMAMPSEAVAPAAPNAKPAPTPIGSARLTLASAPPPIETAPTDAAATPAIEPVTAPVSETDAPSWFANLTSQIKVTAAALGQKLTRRFPAGEATGGAPITTQPAPPHTIWSDLRPLLGYLAVISFFINLLFLVPAIFMQQVYDRVLSSRSQDTLIVLLVGAGAALLILLLLDYLRNRLQNVVGSIIDERLSPPVVQTIVAKAARTPNGANFEGIRDIAALRQVFSANGLVALIDIPWALVYISVIWMFHPFLGIGAACAGVIMLSLAWLNDRVSRRSLAGLQQEGRRASQYVENSLRNAEVLQVLGMTDNLLDRWLTLQDRVTELQSSATRSGVAFTAITRFSRQAIQIAMLSLGAYLVLSDTTSPGSMIATTIILSRAIQPIEQLVGSWRMLTDGRAAYRRLRELSKEFAHGPVQMRMPRPTGKLSAEAISYCPPGAEKKLILSTVSFALNAGEALAIVGPSAAGKSTLARLLTGVWAATSGTVRLDGADMAYWSREELGPWIGYLPQDVELFEGSVADNIARLGQVDAEKVLAAAKLAGVHEMILTLPSGYDTPVGEHGALLSPGQRQRIAYARALYGDPRLVVLDEPNSNLDGAGEAALAQSLGLLRKKGVTSVVVTHRPSLIAHVDKILLLESGRVQHLGPASEVLKAIQKRAQVA